MDALPLPNWDPPALVAKASAPKATGYPLRGSWWTHPGEIHSHLLSGEHRGKWPAGWVRSLSVAEAESLHADDHEGRVKSAYVPKIAATVVIPYTLGVQNCPNGQCPRR